MKDSRHGVSIRISEQYSKNIIPYHIGMGLVIFQFLLGLEFLNTDIFFGYGSGVLWISASFLSCSIVLTMFDFKLIKQQKVK